MNAAEFTALGVVLMKYRDAVDHVDASLMTAVLICDETDPAKAEHIGVARVALLDALMVVDGLLRDGRGKSHEPVLLQSVPSVSELSGVADMESHADLSVPYCVEMESVMSPLAHVRIAGRRLKNSDLIEPLLWGALVVLTLGWLVVSAWVLVTRP